MEEKKLIVAVINDGIGNEYRRLYGIAEPVVEEENVVAYKASDALMERIALKSKDHKIYDMGWIEDAPEPVKELLVDPSTKVAEYQFMADWFDEGAKELYAMFGFSVEEQEEEYKNPWTVKLQLEELN